MKLKSMKKLLEDLEAEGVDVKIRGKKKDHTLETLPEDWGNKSVISVKPGNNKFSVLVKGKKKSSDSYDDENPVLKDLQYLEKTVKGLTDEDEEGKKEKKKKESPSYNPRHRREHTDRDEKDTSERPSTKKPEDKSNDTSRPSDNTIRENKRRGRPSRKPRTEETKAERKDGTENE